MQRKFTFAVGEYYHLYNRGNDKRVIFLDDCDRLRFLVLLYACNDTAEVHLSNYQGKSLMELFDMEKRGSLVGVGAYCLMPNHFHLLVKEETERGISVFMKKVLTGYSMYFNKKHSRSGKLFEGPFKATHVTDDRYLQYLFAYIHLNPVKTVNSADWEKKIITAPKQAYDFLYRYPYSSFVDYLGNQRLERAIINPPAFPKYFASRREFADYINDWIDYSEESP
ncbi:MAG: transposase [Patescibacteria group bacterium]|nr:transposase [Patescibacteria group bacterium]